MIRDAALRRLTRMLCAAPLLAAALPGTAHGASTERMLPAKAVVGTLPLLAALALGIAVAVFAVIAFLQMTKGRNMAVMANGQDDHEPFLHAAPAEARQQPAAPQEDAGIHAPDEVLPDYTIPLTRIPKSPDLPDQGWRGKPRIYGLDGEFAGESFRIGEGGLSIGRDPAVCQIVFPSDAGEISRRHCTIRFEADRGVFLLEDHGSSNGTFLTGGEKLVPGRSYPLKAGDRFSLSGGPHWFEIRD